MTAALAIAVAALSLTSLALAASLLHLRRRHRALRRTLNRVAGERDALRWDRRHGAASAE